ncbi:MAG: 4Fe-4S dicluster domain-containing protein [Promethearchaeota archaeon]|nr:MAG: 4Fe-4S dicluster domain-containing protein [Candidatus Lokiarchaeota archaeon]
MTIKRRKLLICRSTGCNSLDAAAVHDELVKQLKERKLVDVEIKKTGCRGFCEAGPSILVQPDDVLYVHIKPKDVTEIVEKHLMNNEVVPHLVYMDPQTEGFVPKMDEIQFFHKQKKITLEHCGLIDPENIDEYIDLGGYEQFEKCVKESKNYEVIYDIKSSRLRGRGGAGFPTGLKWELCAKEVGDVKYVVCNGDEGDPGAFMDRTLLESDPHSVIEGMCIGAYAIGATQGFIYLRAEYKLAIRRFDIAIKQARMKGFLGKNIFGTGFNFDIQLKKGAGAFVCGEETALMASIEGKRGNPRPRPPFPAQSGLWGKPTNINNVKTWATIPHIFSMGAKEYSNIGTDDASGTVILALTGKINNSGLVEIPMGTTIRDVVFDIGGGIPNGKKFKAIQIGGPSGGCIPANYLDTLMDYKTLTELGAIMGSGGVIVLDEDTCMVDLAHYFITFTQRESCGKCAPCRVGTLKMLDILTKFKKGKAVMEDIDRLKHLAEIVKKTSLCGLGQTAPNPVLTTIRYFRHEYEAHVNGKCSALVCKDLIQYEVIPTKCIGCGLCAKNCPVNAITGEPKQAHLINPQECIRCGLCIVQCPSQAIRKINATQQGGM